MFVGSFQLKNNIATGPEHKATCIRPPRHSIENRWTTLKFIINFIVNDGLQPQNTLKFYQPRGDEEDKTLGEGHGLYIEVKYNGIH